jgi:uncharacterized RDD family membrane protein YckC
MYCSKCGNPLKEDAAFCSACGAPVASTTIPAPTAVPESLAPSHEMPAPPPDYAARKSPAYAGFWLRFVAFVIDLIILFIPFTFIVSFLAVGMGLSAAVQEVQPGESLDALIALLGTGFVLAVLLIMLVGSALYFTLLEASGWQATLGKKALGLYVTDLNGNRASFGRASGRFFAGKFMALGVPGIVIIYFFISCISAGITERKQALHDMLAGCLVLRKL